MDLKNIRKLSNRYWNAETTLEEENQLKQALSSDDTIDTIPDQHEVDYFKTIEHFSSLELGQEFDRELMSKIRGSKKSQCTVSGCSGQNRKRQIL